jgi:hypothetical protein
MSFYARRVLPHIVNLAMRNKDLTHLRSIRGLQSSGVGIYAPRISKRLIKPFSIRNT